MAREGFRVKRVETQISGNVIRKRIGIVGYSGEPALEAAIRYKQAGELDELWGMNIPSLAFIQAVEDGHFSRWFELHSLSVHRHRKRSAYLRWLAEDAPPLYLNNPADAVTIGGELPIVAEQFPGEDMAQTDRRFHCSSVDWLVRYAIHIKASRIWLLGINGTSIDEPDMSNAATHYWLGRAEAQGIEVAAPYSFGILRNVEVGDQWHGDMGNPLYGYDRLARQSGNSYHLDRYWDEMDRLAEVETGEREEMRHSTTALDMARELLNLDDR